MWESLRDSSFYSRIMPSIPLRAKQVPIPLYMVSKNLSVCLSICLGSTLTPIIFAKQISALLNFSKHVISFSHLQPTSKISLLIKKWPHLFFYFFHRPTSNYPGPTPQLTVRHPRLFPNPLPMLSLIFQAIILLMHFASHCTPPPKAPTHMHWPNQNPQPFPMP